MSECVAIQFIARIVLLAPCVDVIERLHGLQVVLRMSDAYLSQIMILVP